MGNKTSDESESKYDGGHVAPPQVSVMPEIQGDRFIGYRHFNWWPALPKAKYSYRDQNRYREEEPRKIVAQVTVSFGWGIHVFKDYPYRSLWQFSGDRLTIVPGSCQFMDTKEYLTKEQETTHDSSGSHESTTHYLPRITGPSHQTEQYEWRVGEPDKNRSWGFFATRELAHRNWYWLDGGGDDGEIRG